MGLTEVPRQPHVPMHWLRGLQVGLTSGSMWGALRHELSSVSAKRGACLIRAALHRANLTVYKRCMGLLCGMSISPEAQPSDLVITRPKQPAIMVDNGEGA